MVAEVAAELPFELIERATLAVSELVTNAVRHGSTTGATITVVATARPQQLTIDVVDMGTGKPAAQSGAGGFGLGIVSQVAESVVIEESDSWRVVVEFTPR
jgi:anti-sigma regulatory factor (Ser/Thr protein kinase)